MGVPLAWDDERIDVTGTAGRPVCDPYSILDMGDSGTSLRLLTTVALLCRVPVIITGSPRMKERPVGGLVSALNTIGGSIQYLEAAGFPPFLVDGNLRGGAVRVDSTVSSQFASSLLMAAPYAESGIELILLPGAVSRSYLDVTVDVMQAFGVAVEREGYDRFIVQPGRGYRGKEYGVEGDYSSASYFFAMAAVCGGRARVSSLSPAFSYRGTGSSSMRLPPWDAGYRIQVTASPLRVTALWKVSRWTCRVLLIRYRPSAW